MPAAFIGFKLKGVAGATIAAGAIFLPSFLMMLSILPVPQRMRNLTWLKEFTRGVSSAVIGAFAVSLAQMAPDATPDWTAWALLLSTMAIMLWRNIASLSLMLGGASIGLVLKEGMLRRVVDFVR